MSEAITKDTTTQATPATDAQSPIRMAVRLTPANNSDQPVLANYSNINITPGMAFIDFGFIEPSLLNALPRAAKRGGKMPERIDAKLAVRVAMGYDGLAGLHQQIGRVLAGLQAASARGKAKAT